jgi:hypothetical protein
MYTALERLEMTAGAKARLQLLVEDPMGCMEHTEAIEKAMIQCHIPWSTLGVTSQEYASLVRQAATICARTYFDRIQNDGHRNCWILAFEKVVDYFKLDYSEFGITRNEFLRLKHWTARIPSRRVPPSAHIGTVSSIRPMSERAHVHVP